jgi:BCL2-like 1 (apoptosis regulator Bcl-X)
MSVSEEFVIVCDYIYYVLAKEGCVWRDKPDEIDFENPSTLCSTVRLLGDEFHRRYTDVFEDMLLRLEITPSTAHNSFQGVVQELFRDGIRWGRIIALVTFAGELAVECHKFQIPQLVGAIADWAATYMESFLDVWVHNNGGYSEIVPYFNHRPIPTYTGFRRFLTNVGVACGALGVITLGAILSGRS